MKQRKDRDGFGFRVHPIEDHERCLGDPRLVDPRHLDVLSGVRVSGRNLKRKVSRRANVRSATSRPKCLMPYSSWLAMSASTRAERTTSCALKIEPRRQALECLVAVNDLAPISLRDAVIQLGALLACHSRIEGIAQQSASLNMLDELSPLGERELGNKLDNLSLRPRHTASLSRVGPPCTQRNDPV